MWQTALSTGLTTGLSPAQQIDITKYYQTEEQKKPDYTAAIIMVSVLLAAGVAVYFITK
jgi:hypothetical protein